jgi:Ca-activated chloride channel family protein
MGRRHIFRAAATVVGLLAAIEVSGRADQVFRSGVEVVVLTATVQGGDGAYVGGLTRDDFRIYNEGAPQRIEFFSTDEVPIDLLLILDTSNSMSEGLRTSQRAALTLIDSLGTKDRAGIMTFGDRADLRQGFTEDRTRLRDAIAGLQVGGRTALYTSLYVALRQFSSVDASAPLRRRALVVLSDGEDTASLMTFDQVIDLARQLGVSIYTVVIRHNVMPAPVSQTRAVSDYEMRAFATETGAQSFFLSAASDLESAYGRIATEIAHQYVLGFIPNPSRKAGTFSRVSVKVVRPGANVRVRTGYMAS